MAVGVSGWLASGCTDEATGRTRIAFDVVIAGNGDGAAESLPTAGTRPIRLDAARLQLGPLTFFEGEALLASRSIVDDLLSFSSARAHPGHYTPGEALADTAAVGVVDLLASAPHVIAAGGLSGAYGSMALPLVGGETLALEGVVLDDGPGLPFGVVVDLAHDVEGIACDVAEISGQRLRLDVQVTELVRRVDTDQLPASSETPIDLGAAPQARHALERALEAQTTYLLTPEEA
jgi:hypothetical protein